LNKHADMIRWLTSTELSCDIEARKVYASQKRFVVDVNFSSSEGD